MDSFVDRIALMYSTHVSSRSVSKYNDMVKDFLLRLGRKKIKRRGPRGQIQSEVPTPIFFRNWACSKDRTFGPIYQGLKDGQKYEQYLLTELRLVYQDEKGYKYCVPHEIAEQVVTAYHSQCHPGVPKLMSLLGRRYIFSMKAKELHSLCWNICHHCQVCQAVKPRKGHVPGTMDFCPIPQEIFSSLCMDFVDIELVKDTEGRQFDCCLVIVCRLSGYIVAIPCKKEGLKQKL